MDDTQPPGTPTIAIEPLPPLPPPPPGMAPQGNDDNGYPFGIRVRFDIITAGFAGEVVGTDWTLVPPDAIGGSRRPRPMIEP